MEALDSARSREVIVSVGVGIGNSAEQLPVDSLGMLYDVRENIGD